MDWKLNLKDSLFVGILLGILSLAVFFYSLDFLRMKLADHYSNPYFFAPPRAALLAVMLNLICFRLLMINFQKEQTAKGILLVTVSAVLCYLYYNKNQFA